MAEDPLSRRRILPYHRETKAVWGILTETFGAIRTGLQRALRRHRAGKDFERDLEDVRREFAEEQDKGTPSKEKGL